MKTHKDLAWDLAELMECKDTSPEDRRKYYLDLMELVRNRHKRVKIVKAAPDSFHKFWDHYPIKKSKETAKKAYVSALKVIDHDTIMRGVEYYKQNIEEGISFAYAATWLNGARWQEGQAEVRTSVVIDRSGWQDWQIKISDALGVAVFQTWFKDALYTCGGDGAQITLPKFQYNWVKDRYWIEIKKLFKDIELYCKKD